MIEFILVKDIFKVYCLSDINIDCWKAMPFSKD